MASKNFIDFDPVAGLIDAAWLNEVDNVVHDVFGNPANTNAALGAIAPGMEFSTNGVLGFNVTPETTWLTSQSVMQLGYGSALITNKAGSSSIQINNNLYYNAGWKRLHAASAQQLSMSGTETTIKAFVTGAADSDASFADNTFTIGETLGSITENFVVGGSSSTFLAWDSSSSVAQVGSRSSLTYRSGDTLLSNNVYQSSTTSYYGGTATAAQIKFPFLGGIEYNVAPSGTIDTAITWLTPVTIDVSGNVVIGTAALATTATDGFLYIPTCAGTPTGTPTAKTGRVPMVFDTTGNKLWVYDGSWIGIVLA